MVLREGAPHTEYMRTFNGGLILDDQIWLEALRRERLLQESAAMGSGPSERMLFHLMEIGTRSDDARFDQASFTSTRALRYSAALSFRLWRLLQTERNKVRRSHLLAYALLTRRISLSTFVSEWTRTRLLSSSSKIWLLL